MFGEKFKELRIAQNISLREATNNVINVSSLSRWENNQLELKFNTVIELLDNIHISPLEFLSITVLSPCTPLISEVDKALGSPIELKRLAIKYLKIYESSPTNENLIDAAIASNFYLDVAKKDIFPNKYKVLLSELFSNIFYWSHYYTTAFGNTTALLDTKTLYGFSTYILNHLSEYKDSGYEYYLNTLSTLLNVYITLIKKDPEKAAKLRPQLDRLNLSPYFIFIDLHRKYYNELLTYRSTHNADKIMLHIQSLRNLGQNKLAKRFIDIFNEIEDLDK